MVIVGEHIPGPSAVINALILSGLPSDKFSFNGFLPKQHEAKRKIAIKLQNCDVTNIFFESGKRISSTISIFSENLSPDTELAICREMTKEYESIYRGTIEEILTLIKNNQITMLGEFVILVYPCSYSVPWLDRSKAASIRYKGILSKIAMTIFIISWLMLAWLGTVPVTALRTTLSIIGTIIYFAFFHS